MEACFTALGREPRLMRVPAAFMRFGAWLVGIVHRRMGEMLTFAVAVSTHECVAPQRGRRRLADYLRERAAG